MTVTLHIFFNIHFCNEAKLAFFAAWRQKVRMCSVLISSRVPVLRIRIRNQRKCGSELCQNSCPTDRIQIRLFWKNVDPYTNFSKCEHSSGSVFFNCVHDRIQIQPCEFFSSRKIGILSDFFFVEKCRFGFFSGSGGLKYCKSGSASPRRTRLSIVEVILTAA